MEILIAGAGTMGASLSQAYAKSGFNVGLVDVSDEILDRALETIESELASARKSGIFTDSQTQEIKSRIVATTRYGESCKAKGLKLVIESATEDIEIKKKIFRTLDELCAPHVVLASNTSSLEVNILARETKRPDKVVWMHFFYLPHKNRAGEYAGTDTASPESIETAAQYMKLAGKVASPILSSRKGGAADVIFVSLLLEAARMKDEGFDVPAIEAAGKKAFNIPLGFLSLMDHTGIPLGLIAMRSFSDSSNPDDPLYKAYDNFFTPSKSYEGLMERYERAGDKSAVKWVSEEDQKKQPEDLMLVDILKNRFLAVAFMTATEVVEAGVIEMEEVDKLCQNAFLWKKGPFSLMNTMGITEALRIVAERMELSHKREINFPVPKLLIRQAQLNKPWVLTSSSVIFSLEKRDEVARIMISNPAAANTLDSQAVRDLKTSFRRANEDKKVKAIIFDSAPIKTFIAGTHIGNFLRNIKLSNFLSLRSETGFWQEVVFHEMTGSGKPKIAIVDGAALGGGAEVALAFALDPHSLVIITDRTSYAFPETRLGIYPGLRGTLTLPQCMYEATEDKDLALGLCRYYILTGKSISSPGVIKFLGLADFLVPARKRDELTDVLVQAIIGNGGIPMSPDQLESLPIEELPAELTPEEEEELRVMKGVFLEEDFIPTLFAYNEGRAPIPYQGGSRVFVEEAARLVAKNSPHAVKVANELITKGFDDFLKGKSLDERAQRELDSYLLPTLQHLDALEGLTAFIEQRQPKFK